MKFTGHIIPDTALVFICLHLIGYALGMAIQSSADFFPNRLQSAGIVLLSFLGAALYAWYYHQSSDQ